MLFHYIESMFYTGNNVHNQIISIGFLDSSNAIFVIINSTMIIVTKLL